MRVLILIKLDDDDNFEAVKVFGSITALNEEYPTIKKSTTQQNIIKNGFYQKDNIFIFREKIERSKRLDKR